MAFSAGAVTGKMKMDNSGWNKGVKGAVKSIGALAIGVGVVAVGAMVKATKSANEWQKSLSNVTTLTDESVVSNQEMAKSLLDLDARLGSTKELTDATYQAFSAGADDLDEALQITKDSAKFARAAVTDTATAVDVLTTAQNAYGKETVSTQKASDIFFTTIKQGKINGEQLSSVIGKSIPLFASLNVPLEELGSGMAAMTKQGVSAAESTTQLNAIMNSFLKPSEDMKAALEAQGFASGSALVESEGLSGALEFLETATGGSKDELSKLLPSVEAVKGALALTGQGGIEFNNILKEMETATGATDTAFEKQELTFETLKNQMEKVELVAGNVGKFFADDIAIGATKAAEGMLTFLTSSSGMEFVANLVGGVSATFELFKTILDPVVDIFKGVFSTSLTQVTDLIDTLGVGAGESSLAFDVLGGISTGLTAIWRINAVAIEGNIENLSNMIIAIKETGGTIGSFFEFLKGNKTWDEVKGQASAAGEAFKNFGLGVADNFADIGKSIVDEVQSFTINATESSKLIESSFKLSFETTSDNVRANWTEMITGQEAFVSEMIENNQELIEEISVQNDELEEDSTTTFQNIWQAMKNLFTDAEFGWKGLYDNIISTVSFGLDAISTLTSQAFTNEEAEQQLSFDTQLAALEENFANGIISQAEFEEQKKALDEQALIDKNALAERQFETEKGLSIASVWVNAATSIAGWWAQAPALGPIAGPIFAGVMTGASLGMAGVQTGLIASQQFVPAKQEGGMASGTTRINEVGGEIVTLPDGSQVIPNDISQQIAGSVGTAGDTIVNINAVINDDIDIERMAERISRLISKRTRVA